jgi:hypothetical protein
VKYKQLEDENVGYIVEDKADVRRCGESTTTHFSFSYVCLYVQLCNQIRDTITN